MPSTPDVRAARAAAVARAYRLRLRAIREEMQRRLGRAYEGVDQADIRATFAAFVPPAARTITAAQASSQTLTRAYIRGASGADPVPVEKLAGTSDAGTMTAALVGIMPMILGAIGRGTAPDEALTMGAGYVTRMADNEVTRVVDAEIGGQVTGVRAVGWIGIVNAPCDMCVSNAGEHTWDEEMVRHPWCQCDRELIWADYAYSVPQLAPA